MSFFGVGTPCFRIHIHMCMHMKCTLAIFLQYLARFTIIVLIHVLMT